MSIILSGSDGLSDVDGSAATPAIRGTDANTGIFFPAADTIAFGEGGSEAMRIDSSGNVGIGTSSPAYKLDVQNGTARIYNSTFPSLRIQNSATGTNSNDGLLVEMSGSDALFVNYESANMIFKTADTERMRITSDGWIVQGGTDTSPAANNASNVFAIGLGRARISTDNDVPIDCNRKTSDGGLIRFRQDGTEEGSISVSGTTVSYNGGHLSRYAQTQATKDESLLKGTVLSNLDEMNVYTDAEGNPVPNEQLNKVKVSDVEGDVNVAGVFVNWYYDEQHQVDEINMAMTGDMIIRIAQGVVVQKGDLLMSAGDGTAKPQGDDIVRSKTIAKVTSNHVTCTYEDGSYCVPCVLMAC